MEHPISHQKNKMRKSDSVMFKQSSIYAMSTRELIRCNTNLSDTCWNTGLSPDSHPVLDFVGLFRALLGLDAICPYILQPWYRGIRDWWTWWRLAWLGKIPDQESSVKTCWSPILHHDLWLLLGPSDHQDRNYQHPQENVHKTSTTTSHLVSC